MNRSERRRTGALPGRAEEAARAARRRLWLYVALGALAVGAVVGLVVLSNRLVPKVSTEAPSVAKLSIGQEAPAFAISTTGGPFDLAAARGKPVLLELFATWCPHCQRETAVLNTLFAKYGGTVHMVAVSASPYGMDSTTTESQADVVNFTTAFNVKYPTAFDPQLDVAKKYLQGGFPTVVLIDAAGKIVAFSSGEIPLQSLDGAIAASLAHKPVNPTFGMRKS